MSVPGLLTDQQILNALCLLLIVFLWNLFGRYVQYRRQDDRKEEAGSGLAARLGGIAHILCLSVVLFVLLIFLISGVLTHVVSFRYEGF